MTLATKIRAMMMMMMMDEQQVSVDLYPPHDTCYKDQSNDDHDDDGGTTFVSCFVSTTRQGSK